MRVCELSGIWLKQYVGFFDTEELKLIKDMANADTLISVWFELMDLAGKLGCSGRFLFHETKPYTDDMLAASLKRTVPSIRQCLQTFVQFDMLEYKDGIYSVAGWSDTQNAETLDAIRKGDNRRAKKRTATGKSVSEKKRERLMAFLNANPGATKVEMQKGTGLSRVTINKYLADLPPLLPHGSSGDVQDVQNVQSVQNDVQKSVQNVQFGDVQMDTKLYMELYTHEGDKPAGRQAEAGHSDDVQSPSRPKIIDDRWIDITSTSTAGGARGVPSVIPTREEVHAFADANGMPPYLADRFYDLNTTRGWVTNNGKPVDDWRGLLQKWRANERTAAPATAPAPSQKEPEHAPTIEEVMAKYGCDRETARIMIDEGMA